VAGRVSAWRDMPVDAALQMIQGPAICRVALFLVRMSHVVGNALMWRCVVLNGERGLCFRRSACVGGRYGSAGIHRDLGGGVARSSSPRRTPAP
jgi:hypothetical protein